MFIFHNSYIFLSKLITFFSISIVNPLTLLIIPLIGSLIILAYPFYRKSDESLLQATKNAELQKASVRDLYPLRFASASDPFSPLHGSLALHAQQAMGREEEIATSATRQVVNDNSAIKELIIIPNINKQVLRSSNLKKIAIITSLINFFISIIL